MMMFTAPAALSIAASSLTYVILPISIASSVQLMLVRGFSGVAQPLSERAASARALVAVFSSFWLFFLNGRPSETRSHRWLIGYQADLQRVDPRADPVQDIN